MHAMLSSAQGSGALHTGLPLADGCLPRPHPARLQATLLQWLRSTLPTPCCCPP
jgi:hypothetical protein